MATEKLKRRLKMSKKAYSQKEMQKMREKAAGIMMAPVAAHIMEKAGIEDIDNLITKHANNELGSYTKPIDEKTMALVTSKISINGSDATCDKNLLVGQIIQEHLNLEEHQLGVRNIPAALAFDYQAKHDAGMLMATDILDLGFLKGAQIINIIESDNWIFYAFEKTGKNIALEGFIRER